MNEQTDATTATMIEEDNEGPGIDAPAIPNPTPVKKTAKKAAVAAEPAEPTHYRIILEENDQIPPTGQFFGVNFKSYMLRPGEEAVVPAALVAALRDCVEETPRIDTNGNVIDFRKKMRFPFTVLGPA